MNNYNQSLAEVANANNTLEEKILRSKQELTSTDPIKDKLTELSQVVGGEFTKGGFDTIAKNLAAKTGLQSLQNLGKNIKAKGIAGGVAQTATDAQQEIIQKGKGAAKDAISKAQSTAQDAVSKAQSTAQDAVSQAQSTAESAVSKAQSTAQDAVSKAQSTAEGAVDDASSAWKNNPLYDAGQRTRLSIANRENLNKGKALLSDEDRNLSPEDLRTKMDSMDIEISKPPLTTLDLINKSRVARGEQPLKRLLTKDELTQQEEDLKSKSKSAAEDVAGEAEEGTSSVRSGAEQAGTGLTGDSTLARVLGGVPDTAPTGPQLAQQTAPVSEPSPPVSTTQTSTPTSPPKDDEEKEDDEEEEEEEEDGEVDEGIETGAETAAGLADPLVGAAEAGIGILGLLLPDLFGSDDTTPTAPAPVGDILSQTSTMGLGN